MGQENRLKMNYNAPKINFLASIFCCFMFFTYVAPMFLPPVGLGVRIVLWGIFIFLYYFLSLVPFICIIPAAASGFVYATPVWLVTEHINDTSLRVLIRVVVIGFISLLELSVFVNGTFPWLLAKMGGESINKQKIMENGKEETPQVFLVVRGGNRNKQ